MTEQNLALALRRSIDEPEQFVAFYRHHFDLVLAYLTRRVYDADLALDLAAESFAQAYVGRRSFRGNTPQEAEAWIYRIAQRQLSRYLRRGKLERKALAKLGLEVPVLDDQGRADIEKLADLDGLGALLRPELLRLTTAQQDALHLRVVDELPYSDVAEQLGISQQAARLRVSRGLRVLAASLEGNPILKELRT